MIIDSQLPLLCKISWYLYGNWIEINTSNVCNWFVRQSTREFKVRFQTKEYVSLFCFAVMWNVKLKYIELNKYCFRKNFKFKVEKDNMGKKKLVNEIFWISYILFFGMYLTKYQNLRIGFQAYFKNIPWKSYPPLKSKKMSFFTLLRVIKVPQKNSI